MSNLTQFAPFAGGGIKSIQTGYIFATPTAGSNEDGRFFDVTISSVNTAKAVPDFFGSGQNTGSQIAYYSTDGASGIEFQILIPRFTSSTNLRIATPGAATARMTGRWYVVESN